jgi:hypothetical protein
VCHKPSQPLANLEALGHSVKNKGTPAKDKNLGKREKKVLLKTNKGVSK